MDIGDATSSRGLAAYSRALTRDAGDALGLLAAKRTKTAFSVGPLTVSYETETSPTAEDAAVQAAESLHRMRAFNFADSLQTQQLLAELTPGPAAAQSADSAISLDPGQHADRNVGQNAGSVGAQAAQAVLTGAASPTRTPAAGARAYARSAALLHRPSMIQTAV